VTRPPHRMTVILPQSADDHAVEARQVLLKPLIEPKSKPVFPYAGTDAVDRYTLTFQGRLVGSVEADNFRLINAAAASRLRYFADYRRWSPGCGRHGVDGVQNTHEDRTVSYVSRIIFDPVARVAIRKAER
jgi:hypothetical protein